MSEETGKRIGDYEILNELGSGGMGRVYKVRNVISDRIEAMKVLLPDLAGRQELAARFLREIKLMAALNHPNIAALHTAFTADNQLVMIMEYVEGTTLAERLEHGPIPAAQAVNYIDQVLNALSYAHQQHVIHRDIKPANMMLTSQGVVKLMDFGIARAGGEHSLTMTGTTLGSLGYMSPEQVKGEATDARSDLYSVGVSLYEMVTGQRPFQASSDYSIMAAHVKETPKPPIELHPGLPEALNEIILMAIAKDPAQRFQTADAFRNALSTVHIDASATQAVAPASPDAVTAETILPLTQSPSSAAAASRQSAEVQAPAAKVAPAPVPSSAPLPPPPPHTGGHRGLYMTLGALIVLAVLVVGGIYIPRRSKTEAQTEVKTSGVPAAASNAGSANAGSQAPSQQGQTQQALPDSGAPAAASNPTNMETAQPSTPAANAASPAMPSSGQTQSQSLSAPASGTANSNPVKNAAAVEKLPTGHAQKQTMQNSSGQETPAPAQAADNVNAPQPANDAASLDELEHQVDQLSNRAAAVNSSLDRLQQQQNAAGYGLRGDIAARQASMKNNLAKAQDAVGRGDTQRAKRYMDSAESDVEALENFLGR